MKLFANARPATLGACSLLAAALAGCASQPASDNHHSLSSQPASARGEHLLMLDDSHWLSVGPDAPIQLGQQGSNRADIWQGNWSGEFLDAKQHGEQIKVISLDDQQRLHLLTLNSRYELQQDALGPVVTQPLEGLCLYAPQGDALQLFLLDESATAQQLMLSVDGKGPKASLKTTLLRSFATAPGAEYCVTDDQRDQLYISEQATGVWAMNARAESDPSRAMIDLTQPFGHIREEAGALSIQQGSLWLAEAKSNQLHQYRLSDRQYLGNWQLPEDIKIDTLLSLSDGKLSGAMNKHDKSLVTLQLPSVAASVDNSHIVNIAASQETDPVGTLGDAADDPAIWVNPHNPQQSRVLGTNKKHSLNVYDLQGKQLQELAVGRVNNVDVRQGFSLRGKPMDIATASHRDLIGISMFSIDPKSGKVAEAGVIPTSLKSVYGLCMYKNQAGDIFTIINSEDGHFEQYQITDSANGWQGKLVRQFAVATQPEGCAADDRNQRLFLGEENRAVWTLDAEPDASTAMTEVAGVGDVLVADIEGMDIYQTADANYLVVSSQGNDSYAVYSADAPYQYLGRFRVGMNADKGIDGASETDGLTVTSANLGADYPQGMLVVQDGRNLMPEQSQNFKYVDWRSIQQQLKLR
ncbi:phytase [Oceanobacter mangrovi]|uniref:phytase n=1 Tax=Oceanobacter mangrovi TaxID=2862510 RepID=UPI001C8D47C5|nr:phytase [Oceanobacter mangrovi]